MEKKKIMKLIAKIEKKYENVGPIEQKRLLKKTNKLEKRLEEITR